ncbi:MAG: orotidine-5'-phosphate decarboxylase, partial [Solibacillus sp.]
MNRPIIALDFLGLFPKNESLFLKVGMELFYKEGPSIVEELIASGHDIFLDLKLHDIPNTVYSAMRNIAELGVKVTNVHAAGGKEMMKAAFEGLADGTKEGHSIPELIAVTQLTSTSERQMNEDQLISVSLKESVAHYAKITEEAGLDGVVCSAQEVALIKEATNQSFVCLTPGIRLKDGEVGDQKRV